MEQGHQQRNREPLLYTKPTLVHACMRRAIRTTYAFQPSNYQEKVINFFPVPPEECKAITTIWNMSSGFLIQYNSFGNPYFITIYVAYHGATFHWFSTDLITRTRTWRNRLHCFSDSKSREGACETCCHVQGHRGETLSEQWGRSGLKQRSESCSPSVQTQVVPAPIRPAPAAN